jgi:hypothetical protein
MNYSRDARGSLVVTDVPTFVRALLVLAIGGFIAALLAPIPAARRVEWAAVCAIFAIALAVANERSTFLFDRRDKVVRWRRDSVVRHSAGEIPFANLTALSVERGFRSATPSRGRGGGRRLVLLTSDGPLPFSNAFTGWGDAAERTGREIQRFFKDADAGIDLPLRTP